MKYIRTCDECGHKQEAKDPDSYIDKAGKEPWRDLCCKKCGSNAMDYGTWIPTTPEEIKRAEDFMKSWNDMEESQDET